MNRRYPAEWEPQAAIWLTWPANAHNWDARRNQIEEFYVKLIETLCHFQTVCILVPYGWKIPDWATARLRNLPFFPRFFEMATNDIWIRDYGPLFIKEDGVTSIVKFEFNSWGNKFPPFDLDNAIPVVLGRLLGCSVHRFKPIIEGGALEFNGDGLCLTTEDCLIGKSRNPESQRASIIDILKKACGVRSLLVLPGGLDGDHTDGHIDNVARFVAPNHVVMAYTDDPKSPNFATLQKSKSLIEAWLKGHYPDFRLDLLPLPPQRILDSGDVLPASYMNFIYVNKAVVVPTYDCPSDSVALDFFRKIYPNRKIISIDCRCVIEEGGSLHCMSKQQPL